MSDELRAWAAFDEGVRLQAAGEVEPAIAAFERTLQLRPDNAASWANLALLHEQRGDIAAALAAHERALELDPDAFEARLNHGALLGQLRRYDEAERAYRHAIGLRPQAPQPWSNLGAMLALVDRDEDALACCLRALELEPANAKARLNLSYLLLRQGRLAEGFLCLEARAGIDEMQVKLDAPRWDGADLAGRRLLVVSDAGHGDLLMMARYLPLLRRRHPGAVLLYGQPALGTLLARADGVDAWIDYGAPLPRAAFDCWTPAMSLPHLHGTTLDDIPATLPYLAPEPARQAHWRAELERGRGSGDAALRVGLCWRGNPAHENNAERSLPGLAVIAPLADVAGVRWFNLQSGAGADEAPPAGFEFTPLSGPLGDFAETAAIIANLDLVITVDTAIGHLAGAIGRPVWVLVPAHLPDWRWFKGRSDSPWYPGVLRLFRQRAAGNWGPMMDEVAQALADRVRESIA
ncbi:MAG: tetratricopeptide repeat protein [Burkholderiales bacterium]|nr:tetratricopeptide repeat protein [Burkholderiales bacterium]